MTKLAAPPNALGLASQAREVTRALVEQWFSWMDSILDIHRSNFVFRNASVHELREHELGLKLAIRHSLMFCSVIADPDFNEPVLVSRLRVRMQQLQDAYDTLHDATLSDEQAEKVLKEVFPE